MRSGYLVYSSVKTSRPRKLTEVQVNSLAKRAKNTIVVYTRKLSRRAVSMF